MPEKFDYVIRFGNVQMDLASVASMIKRMGIRVKHLEGRLTQSFKTLYKQNIRTIDIRLPGTDRQSLYQFKTALQIIASYNNAIEKEAHITFKQNGQQIRLDLALDDTGQPDPNLTALAALNNLGPTQIQALVNKILAVRSNPKLAGSPILRFGVYKTIFALKGLREKLVRPPIEVNADHAAGSNESGGSADQPGASTAGIPNGQTAGEAAGAANNARTRPQPIMGDVVSKAEVANYVMQTYGGAPEDAANVMKSIYSHDYKELDISNIGDRLVTLTTLLARLEKSDRGKKLIDAITRQIEAGLDLVSDDMLDDIVVQDNEIKVWDGESAKSVAKVPEQLADIIKDTKNRSAVKRRRQLIVSWEEGFGQEDFEVLAKNHGIPKNEVAVICKLFSQCFDRSGNFQKAAFEQQIPAFAEHPNCVFEILWDFLKISTRRSDRLPFLNSFQLLNDQIQQPIKIMRILLSEFTRAPEAVSFLDRNAMMLMTQFLRTYNKERHLDIEITPEEVLLIKDGLDPKVTNYAAWKVDGEREKAITKIVTIRKHLIQALEDQSLMAEGMAFKFLLALEREVNIFLALSGGKTAEKVIRGGLNVYGNPESGIYQFKGSYSNVGPLMQHLAVLIRSMARLGQPDDIKLLTEIKKRHRFFAELEDSPRHKALVRRVIGWTDPAIREIQSRTPASREPESDKAEFDFELPG